MRSLISLIFSITLTPVALAQFGNYIPSKIRIGADLSYLGMDLINPDRAQFELNGDLDVDKYFIAGDYGWASRSFNEATVGENFAYKNSGTYYRIGLDYNVVKKIPNDQIIFMGLRYASSQFTENFQYQVNDILFGDVSNSITDVNRSGWWLEFVAGMKVRVWNGLFLGWTGRFKFAKTISSSTFSSFDNYWIPGYGKSKNDSMWGLNYHIFYRIPFRKKKEIVKKKTELE